MRDSTFVTDIRDLELVNIIVENEHIDCEIEHDDDKIVVTCSEKDCCSISTILHMMKGDYQ